MKKAVVLTIVLSLLLCGCGKASDDVGSGEVLEESGWNVYTYSETESGYGYTKNDYPVSGGEELQALLNKAGSELKIPSYIPDGYTFESANVSYYLTKDMLDSLTAEEREDENGNVEYKYILPDDVLTQIEGFNITYKDDNGNELVVCADYVESMEMGTDGSESFPEIETAGYEVSRAGILYDKYTGEFFRKASPVYEYDGKSEKGLNCIFVQIFMTDIDNEQVVKIAESM